MLETHIDDIEHKIFASFQMIDEMGLDECIQQKNKNFECHYELIAEMRLALIDEIKYLD